MALFTGGSGELPSIAEIAARSGIAKGTVYLYFRTKETIFSALLLQGWGTVVELLDKAFRAGNLRPQRRVRAFLNSYVAYLEGHRELLQLDALRPMLERNLEMDTLRVFKQTFEKRLDDGGALIDHALGLPPGRGVKLLMRTHALTSGLWQSFGDDLDFFTELAEALADHWRGALA